jgi:hypothetical protein
MLEACDIRVNGTRRQLHDGTGRQFRLYSRTIVKPVWIVCGSLERVGEFLIQPRPDRETRVHALTGGF